MTIEIDDADPCDAARKLRSAYLKMITGHSVQQVRFRSGGNNSERLVTYNPGDPKLLLAAVREFEALCAGRSKRRALHSGGSIR